MEILWKTDELIYAFTVCGSRIEKYVFTLLRPANVVILNIVNLLATSLKFSFAADFKMKRRTRRCRHVRLEFNPRSVRPRLLFPAPTRLQRIR